MVRHQGAELLTRILAALIRVVQQGIGLATAPDRHDERIRHELRGHLRLHETPNLGVHETGSSSHRASGVGLSLGLKSSDDGHLRLRTL